MKRVVSSLAHASGGLVQQDHVGTACDGDADFQRTLFGIGQVHGQGVTLLVEGLSSPSALWLLVGAVDSRKRRKVYVAMLHGTLRHQVLNTDSLGRYLVIWKLRGILLISYGAMPFDRLAVQDPSPLVVRSAADELNSVDLPRHSSIGHPLIGATARLAPRMSDKTLAPSLVQPHGICVYLAAMVTKPPALDFAYDLYGGLHCAASCPSAQLVFTAARGQHKARAKRQVRLLALIVAPRKFISEPHGCGVSCRW